MTHFAKLCLFVLNVIAQNFDKRNLFYAIFCVQLKCPVMVQVQYFIKIEETFEKHTFLEQKQKINKICNHNHMQGDQGFWRAQAYLPSILTPLNTKSREDLKVISRKDMRSLTKICSQMVQNAIQITLSFWHPCTATKSNSGATVRELSPICIKWFEIFTKIEIKVFQNPK